MTTQVQEAGCLAHGRGPTAGAELHYAYYRPRTWDELSAVLESEPSAQVIAGGTDVMVRVRQRVIRPPALVSLRGIPELHGIAVEGGRIRIGAATPITDVVTHPAVCEMAPVLVQALLRLGSQQIRNVATLGGNLGNASPCADSAPALMVLDASVRIRGRAGSREIAIGSLFAGPGKTCLEPGELISDILIEPAQGARAVFLKKSRVYMDLAQASVAVLVHADGAVCRQVRVAAGAVGPTPLRLTEVEQLVEGKPMTLELLEQVQASASRAIAPISDVRASEAYRRVIVGVFVKRALQQLIGLPGRPS